MKIGYLLSLLAIQIVLSYFAFISDIFQHPGAMPAFFVFLALIPFFIIILSFSRDQIFWVSGASLAAIALPLFFHVATMKSFPVVGLLVSGLILMVVWAYGGVMGVIIRTIHEKQPWLFVVFAPAVISALEYVRLTSALFFFLAPANNGFVTLLAGVPPLVQMSSITGMYGPYFVLFMAAAAMAVLLLEKLNPQSWVFQSFFQHAAVRVLDKAASRRQWKMAGIVGGILLLLVVAGNFEAMVIAKRQAESESTVAPAMLQLQIDPSRQPRWNRTYQDAILAQYQKMIAEAKNQNAELLLFSENAVPVILPGYMETWQAMTRLISEEAIPAFLGVVTRADDETFFDTWYFIDRTGKVDGYYNKRYLVPFGEYIPLRSIVDPVIAGINYFFKKSYYLFKVTTIDNDRFDLTSGREDKVFNLNMYGAISIKICAEVLISSYFRESARNGAELFLSPSTVNWFATRTDWNSGIEAACFRAVETRRWIGRVASMGASSAVDALGIVRAQSPYGQQSVLVKTMPMLDYQTFYTRFGDIFAWLCISLCLVFSFLALRPKQGDRFQA